MTGSASAIIRGLIALHYGPAADDPHDLRPWVAKHAALPVTMDMGGGFALSVTGEVLSFLWDDLERSEVVEDARLRRIALYLGSLKYSELAPFVPDRPSEAVPCPHCHGAGGVAGLPQELDNIVCYCGGLGWLAQGEAEQAARGR